VPYKDPEKKKQYANDYYQKNKKRHRDYDRQWRKLNPEKVKAIWKRNYKKNKDWYRVRSKEYYQKNKEWYYNYQKWWRKLNPEKVRAKQRRYYEKNKALCDQRSKEWRKNNPKTRTASQKIIIKLIDAKIEFLDFAPI